MNALFEPPDNEHYLRKWRDIGGVCGPSCIAVLERTSIEAILNRWLGVGLNAFRGFTPIAELKSMLTKEGYSWRYVRGGKAKTFPVPSGDFAIVRIQWLQEDGTEYYWRAAGAHTHYVLMERREGDWDIAAGWWVFCNTDLWFPAQGARAQDYLKPGFVSSYLEIARMRPP